MIRNGKRQAERQVVRKNGQPRGPWGRGGQLYFALLQRRLLPICLASINELDDDGVSNGPVNIDAVNEALIKHRGGNYKLLPSPPPPTPPVGALPTSSERCARRNVRRKELLLGGSADPQAETKRAFRVWIERTDGRMEHHPSRLLGASSARLGVATRVPRVSREKARGRQCPIDQHEVWCSLGGSAVLGQQVESLELSSYFYNLINLAKRWCEAAAHSRFAFHERFHPPPSLPPGRPGENE